MTKLKNPEDVLIEPDLWNLDDHSQAFEEGWVLYASDMPGRTCIRRIASALYPFASDLQASEYVLERMHQGSEFHTRAWVAVIKAQMHGAKG